MKKKILQFFALTLLFSFLTACSPSISKTQFYLLPEPQSLYLENTDKAKAKHIAVMPVLIPSYLNRTEILLKAKNSSVVEVAQNKRWAEDLDTMLQRLVSISLSNELASENTFAFPLSVGFPIDYRLSIEISHFEGNFNSDANINAYWVLRENDKTLAQGKFIQSQPVSQTFESYLDTQSTLIQNLSKEIANEYKKLK